MSPVMSASTVGGLAVFVERFVTRKSRSPACRPLTKLRTLAYGPLIFKSIGIAMKFAAVIFGFVTSGGACGATGAAITGAALAEGEGVGLAAAPVTAAATITGGVYAFASDTVIVVTETPVWPESASSSVTNVDS